MRHVPFRDTGQNLTPGDYEMHSRISRAVRNEDSVKVVGDLVHRVVVWEAGHRATSAHEAPENVLCRRL